MFVRVAVSVFDVFLVFPSRVGRYGTGQQPGRIFGEHWVLAGIRS